VNELRQRQIRNFLATLFFSQGVPMLQAGDEFARTQRGNNNPYCQDNEISWIDWRLRGANRELLRFVRLLAQLRRRHIEFRRETFLKGAASRAGVKDVIWLSAGGSEITAGEWHDPNLRAMAVWFGKQHNSQGRLLLLVNGGDGAQTFALPAAPAGEPWICQFDTAHDARESRSLGHAHEYHLDSSSVALLEC
jgi:glycogen operon protein